MDSEQKKSVPHRQGWRNYQFDIIVLITTGALIAYLLNRLTVDQPVPGDYVYEGFLDSIGSEPFYYDTLVDCPPCDERIKYEWFYVEPPLDNYLPEEEFLTEKAEGGKVMDP